MPASVTLPRQFSTDNPVELKKQLERMTEALDVQLRGQSKDFVSRARQLGQVNPTSIAFDFTSVVSLVDGQSLAMQLPRPDPKFSQRRATVLRKTAEGTVTITAPGALVNGETSYTLPAVIGFVEFLFDGANYFTTQIPDELPAGTEEGQGITWRGGMWIPYRSAVIPDIDPDGNVDITPTMQALFASVRRGAWIYMPEPNAEAYKVGEVGVAGPATIFAPTNGIAVTGRERGHAMGSRVFSPGNAAVGTRLNVHGTGKLFAPTQQVTIGNFEIYYPDQVKDGTPDFYDYTFHVAPNWHGCTIFNISAINPYQFFYLHANGFKMADVEAYPLHRGCVLGRVADVARFHAVHFTPNLSYDFGLNLHNYVRNNMVMWLIAGAEQFNMTDCFGSTGKDGILFDDHEGDNFQGAYGSWKGGGIEGVKNCIRVSGSATRCLPTNGFRMFGAELVPDEYGVLFEDDQVAAQPGELPGIHLVETGIHSGTVHQYAVRIGPNSRANFSMSGGLLQPSANASEILKESTQSFVTLRGVQTYSGRTRISGAGSGSNVIDANPVVLVGS